MAATDPKALAQELMSAYAHNQIITAPPSARDPDFNLVSAYEVETQLAQLRRADGRMTVGRKVGYANKALWRVLKLETLVWAHMYDDTVRFAPANKASLSVGQMCSPKIEPEIVFKLKHPLRGGITEPATVLEAVEWLALGFEIIDCVFAGWKYKPSDFVAAFGLHAALIVGQPRTIGAEQIPALADQLSRFKIHLSRDRQIVDEGSGRNSLRSPALCLGELATAIDRQSGAEPLEVGELISSGTLTDSHPITANQTWAAVLEGIELPNLVLHTLS
jgi:2-keto-4-pentenoate hydratase